MNKEEKQESKRLPGFYIALCCCVIAVGIAGYFTERASNRVEDDTAIVGGNISGDDAADDSVPANVDANGIEEDTLPQIYIDAQGEPEAAASDAQSEEASVPKVIYEDLENDAQETAAIIATPSFSMPAQGEILEAFSDTLDYNSALGDWRTHNGIDIAVDAGGSVMAAADGTISRISSDAMGEYVIIEHDGGFTTKYCALASVEDIAEGSEIKAGEVIGIVSDSKAENVKDTHLHFEVYKDGTAVNPSEYVQ